MDQPLSKLLATTLDDIAHLVGLLAGGMNVNRWQAMFARSLLVHHTAALLTGRGATSLTPGMRAQLKEIVGAQVDYLNAFADAIARGELSPAQIAARANLYAGAIKQSYSRGQHLDWPLPFHPSEGSECAGACKCSWELDVIDAENLDADAYWNMGGSEHHCTTCPARAAANPYKIREGVLL